MDPLDPAHLTPAASLNRLRIVALPGVALPPEVAGRIAYDFLSAAALADEVLRAGDVLDRDDTNPGDTDATLRRFDRAFASPDPAVRAAATALAARFGGRLGYLILALRRGDAANRQARADWDDSYWAHWASVATIHLGGGLLAGRAGPPIVAGAARCLRDAGMADCALRLAAHPALLPLIGAARSAPPDAATALAFDFGQSFVKRARAAYADGVLVGLRLSPALPVRAATLALGAAPGDAQIRQLGDSIVTTMADTWRATASDGQHPAPLFVASIASYLRDEQPLPRQGGPYSTLHTLAPRLSDWLAARLGAALGRAVVVRLLHDGTAAALAVAGAERAATITLGTALGVGFPPPAHGLRPLAAAFAAAWPAPRVSPGLADRR